MPLFPLPGNSGTLYLALRLDAIDNVLRGEEFGVSPRDMRARRFGSFPLLDLLVKTMPFALEGAAHTQAHAVYRKLDASSRSQAVARARDVGLIDG